jgi:pimeloyl-ACP methyl ester carboxylesterase
MVVKWIMERCLWKWTGIVLLALFSFACSDKNDPSPTPPDEDNLVEATLIGSRAAVELQLLIQFSGRNIDPALFAHNVDVYKVIYKTTFKDSEINASGLIFLPKTTDPVGMISFQHGTIVRHADAPSVQDPESLEVVSYAALTSMGFITVVPDMIGFGESKEIFHPYYVEEPTAVAVIDLLRSAETLAEEKQIPFNSKLFLAGYSQGGYATMATHKALEENPLENFDLIASFPAAGGYDISAMQEYFFGLDTYRHPFYLAYVGQSYQEYYDNPALLADFFNEPYASTIPGLFDGLKGQDAINDGLTEDIQALVRPEVIADIGVDPQYDYLKEAFAENSLVDWKPTIPMFMYHGDADTTVPFENSQVTYDQLLANGASADIVKFITLPGADHSTGIEPYVEEVIKKLQELK